VLLFVNLEINVTYQHFKINKPICRHYYINNGVDLIILFKIYFNTIAECGLYACIISYEDVFTGLYYAYIVTNIIQYVSYNNIFISKSKTQ